MSASAIAAVLNGYTGLFDTDEHALYVYPFKQSINIDGYDEDWDQLKQQFTSYANNAFSGTVLEPGIQGQGVTAQRRSQVKLVDADKEIAGHLVKAKVVRVGLELST